MWGKRPTYRFHLSSLEVAYPDGTSSRVRWLELADYRKMLKPSPAARTLDPRLPKTIALPAMAGVRRIHRLRIRAACRALATGTYDRFWRHDARNRTRSIGRIACLCVTAYFGLLISVLMAAQHTAQDAGATVFDREFRTLWWQGTMPPTAIGFAALLAIFIPRRKRRSALALRATATGIQYHWDDGQITFRPWREAARFKHPSWLDARSLIVDRAGCDPDFDGSDWCVLNEAVIRTLFGIRPKRAPIGREMRSWLLGTTLFGVVFGAAAFAILMLGARADTVDHLQRQRPPPSTGEAVVYSVGIGTMVWCIFASMLAIEVGGRRMLRECRRWLRRRTVVRRPPERTMHPCPAEPTTGCDKRSTT